MIAVRPASGTDWTRAGEGGVEQTVAAGADLRLDELLGRGGPAEVDPGEDQSPAGNAHGGHPGPGRELHETPPPDHVLPLLGLPGAIRMRRNDWMWRTGPWHCLLCLVRSRAQGWDAERIGGQNARGFGRTTTTPIMSGWIAQW